MSDGSVKRVLVVDDDEATRRVIRSILESCKTTTFEVFEAADGVACLMELERRAPVDLILLDVEMPEMDGYEVCTAIRRVDRSIPIVFVTSHNELLNRVKAREVGGDSFVSKPVQAAPLLALIGVLTGTEQKPHRRGSSQLAV